MNLLLALSSVTFALQVAAAIAAFAIARAPGWERVRIVAWLAVTAGLYSLFDAFGYLYLSSDVGSGWVTRCNLTVAALHSIVWLWYSLADSEGRLRSIPPTVRLVAGAHLLFTLWCSLSGAAVDITQVETVRVSALKLEFVIPALSAAGTFSAAVTVLLLAWSLSAQWQQARRGVPGAAAIVVGFMVFVACGTLEVLVAAGQLDFIYVAEIGYIGLVVPVTAQLLRRFGEDARRLQSLSLRLADEVRTATTQRDEARDALLVQERFAALGRIAAGVGHEINNPLQYLQLSLEELRDAVRERGVAGADEAFTNAFDASARIQRVVEGLRTYSQGPPEELKVLDPTALVMRAVAAAAPSLRDLPAPRLRMQTVPHVVGDESRLVQALENALVNAAAAVRGDPTRPASIDVATRTSAKGDVVIEVRDNGPGFPPELIRRLGEPFVTTRPHAGSTGLGLFIARGIVDAHRGALELENAREGGAVVRFVLPAVRLA